jgi:hypothetical protein
MKPKTIEELEEKHAKEISDIRHDVNSMRQELKNLSILLNESEVENRLLKDSVKRIVVLLEGDPIDPMRGLVNRLILIEKFVNSMKSLRQYLMGNIAAAVFIIGFIGGVLAFLYKAYEFFNNK